MPPGITATVKDSFTVQIQTDKEASTEKYSAAHRDKRDEK